MGTKVRDRKDITVSFKLDTEQYAKMIQEMKRCSILNVSKFIRQRIFGTGISYAGMSFTDRQFRDQINKIIVSIESIGKNYNNTTSRLQQLCELKKRDGSPLVNSQMVHEHLKEMVSLMHEVKERMEEVIEIVSDYTEDDTNQ